MMTKNSKTKEILKYLAIGSGVIVISMLNPLFPLKLLKTYTKHRKIQRKKFFEDLKRLQRRDLIEFKIVNDDKIKITLKKQGREKTLEYEIDEMRLDKNKRWDGKWQLIIFDIPKNKKKEREAFRKKLIELELYPLQESVYITPYKCGDEIDFICEFFKIRNCVLLLTVSDFEGSEKLKYFFKL